MGRISRQTVASALGIVALTMALAALAQERAAASVYRCKQANGSVAYQDFPCKGGITVDIKPETPDPYAIDRLQRQQADFDRAYAQRQAEEAAQRARQPVAPPRATLPPQAENDFESYDAPGYVFYGGVPRAGFPNRDKHVMHHNPPRRPKPTAPGTMNRSRRLENL